MTQKNYYLGAFLITMGLLWLNQTLAIFPINLVGFYNYWSLFLVLWGLSIMIPNTKIRAIISFVNGIFTALFIFSLVIEFTELEEEKINELKDKIEKKVDSFEKKLDKI